MKKLELNQMENLEGGKFWGFQIDHYECHAGQEAAVGGYYIFGLLVDEHVTRYTGQSC